MQEKLDRIESGINVVSVQLTRSTPPRQVKPAFEASTLASQNKDKATTEARTFAETTLNEAAGPHAEELFDSSDLTPEALSNADMSGLTDETELELIKVMAGWPRIVEQAALAHEPHRVAFYLNDLASVFHLLWNKGRDESQLRFLNESDLKLSRARLALIQGVAFVIASGLNVFGVTPVEEMR